MGKNSCLQCQLNIPYKNIKLTKLIAMMDRSFFILFAVAEILLWIPAFTGVPDFIPTLLWSYRFCLSKKCLLDAKSSREGRIITHLDFTNSVMSAGPSWRSVPSLEKKNFPPSPSANFGD